MVEGSAAQSTWAQVCWSWAGVSGRSEVLRFGSVVTWESPLHPAKVSITAAGVVAPLRVKGGGDAASLARSTPRW